MEPIKLNLSVALAVYNEEDNLATCLDTIKDLAGEIIIVDGASTDRTVEIGESYGAKIIKDINRPNFHINKQLAIDACSGDWILQLDADERVSSMLASEIKQIVTGPQTGLPAAYYLKRRNYFLGRWMNKGGMYPDPVIRLFQKGQASLPQASVHELMKVTGGTGWLQNDLLHLADPNFVRYLLRSNRYTTLQAEDWLHDGHIGTGTWDILLYIFLKPLARFLSIYLRHKGFMDGFPGFVFALYSGLHIATSYVKYWEKKIHNP
ncbi:MAG: Glycosyl transferase family 2 [Microgenomates group bacterium GW2011_GWC2_45_8]|nr:MAG: Glycosyl transferase family 2 [Microgenomates group bacterium GW2011_GWC2_45_8]KKU26227.1 MAG: Glycosyl transferase family 2 [Microgenomates group bacterium GW2011_GWA2_46_16]